MKFKHLFSPIRIRGLTLKNRVVFPAMGTKMATRDRFVTQRLIDYHVARALGGNGLNMVEVCSVHAPSAPKGFLSIARDEYIPELKKLTDAIHAAGGKAGLQLWQGGLAVGADPEAQIVLADPMPVPGTQFTLPAATPELLGEIVAAYGEAARRAVAAGFDLVELHGAHNYSVHSFLSPGLNHRTDEYGGSFGNRARYPLAVISAIRANLPEDMPLFLRVDAHDDYLADGLTIEDIIAFCKLAGEAGVDVLDVSRGNIVTNALQYEVPPVDLPRGFNVENAARIRRETGMLTVAVGRINDPAQAERILMDEKADLVVIGRGQLADPQFCQKAMEEREDDIVKCVGCNQGCYDGFVDPFTPHITCLRNPALGREREYAPSPAQKPKRVLILGGGMAGLEAAITLKKRGHHPIVLEATDSLGGQFVLAGAAPRKKEMADAAKWMGDQAVRVGVEIHLRAKATPDAIAEYRPDEVIVAIGATPIKLDIPGIELMHVADSHTVLAGGGRIVGRVAVIGGGIVGLEVAEYLAQREHPVTVIEMLDAVGSGLGQLRKISVLENLAREGVALRTNAKVVGINYRAVTVESNGAREEIVADTVVVAVGANARPHADIEEACRVCDIPCHVIGDAVRARRALNATAEAAAVARMI